MKQTPDSIGYIELIYAVQNNIPYRQGPERGREIRQGGSRGRYGGGGWCGEGHAGRLPRFHHQCSGRDVLSDLQLHWLLIPAQIPDAAKRDAIKGFLNWMLTDGQNYNEGLSYAKLAEAGGLEREKAISLIQ